MEGPPYGKHSPPIPQLLYFIFTCTYLCEHVLQVYVCPLRPELQAVVLLMAQTRCPSGHSATPLKPASMVLCTIFSFRTSTWTHS